MKVIGRFPKTTCFVLLLVFLLLYSLFLERTPVHLNQDELGFALNAHSIAKTGRDESNRLFPLYFWHLGEMWATPVATYFSSLFLLLLPLTEATIRFPSVVTGLISIILVFLLVMRLTKSQKLAILAAFLLIFTPSFFIHSRLLLDNLYIAPFVLGWLLLLHLFLKEKKMRYLFWSNFVLGLGFHSYHAAKVMMPFYLLLSILVILPKIKKQKKKSKKYLLICIAAFLLPLIPLIPWLLKYPGTFIGQVRYTGLYKVEEGFIKGIIGFLTPESFFPKLKIFLLYFNPVFLFLRGDQSLIHSTWRSGVFPVSYFFLLPIGIYWALFKKKTRYNILIVLGFFSAPLAAAIAGDHYRISRALVILPFATILAVYGVRFLFSQRSKLLLISTVMLLFAIPLQFSYFAYDYFTDYRIRSYEAFRYNLPGALERVIQEGDSGEVRYIYLDNRINNIDRYWKFYLIKHNKLNLLSLTRYFDPQKVELDKLPTGSLVLYHFDHVDGQKGQIGPFTKVANIIEPDGTSRFFIYGN